MNITDEQLRDYIVIEELAYALAIAPRYPMHPQLKSCIDLMSMQLFKFCELTRTPQYSNKDIVERFGITEEDARRLVEKLSGSPIKARLEHMLIHIKPQEENHLTVIRQEM